MRAPVRQWHSPALALGVLGACVLCVALYVPFKTALAHHSMAHARARYYLTLPVCTDATVHAALGPHNLCDASRALVATSPVARAVHATLAAYAAPLAGAVPRLVWALAVCGVFALWTLMRVNTRLAAQGVVYQPHAYKTPKSMA